MNVDGNGNDPHSNGEKFPRTFYCGRLAWNGNGEEWEVTAREWKWMGM